MSISVTQIERITSGVFRFTVSPSTYYDVWLQGKQLTSHIVSTTTTYTYDGWTDTEEPPPLEFVDYGEKPDSYAYPPYSIIQWFGNTSVYYYSIEKYVNSVWVVETSIPETGQGYYQYQTPVQIDGITVQYRIVPYDSAGFVGAPLGFSVIITAHPVPPSVDVTYDSGDTQLDVTERT